MSAKLESPLDSFIMAGVSLIGLDKGSCFQGRQCNRKSRRLSRQDLRTPVKVFAAASNKYGQRKVVVVGGG